MSKPLIDRYFACPKYVQKNLKKQLTSPCYFEILSSHTVTTEQKQKHMRTKTLLIAAAALAVGAGISMAQTYSQNVVGYANVTVQGGVGKYTLVANPFDDGNGNQITNLLTSLPAGSQVLIWNGSGYTPFNNSLGVWANTNLPPGKGFFVRNGNGIANRPTTNITFVGTVVVPSAGSVTNAVPTGYSLWGSPIPYAGDLCDIGTSAGDTNLNVGASLAKGSQVLAWSSSLQTYVPATKSLGIWGATVTINVGDGFFIKTGTTSNWVQNAVY
jgi:hypothetical protein